MSIIVNSRSIFCLSWKNAPGALATQNKKRRQMRRQIITTNVNRDINPQILERRMERFLSNERNQPLKWEMIKRRMERMIRILSNERNQPLHLQAKIHIKINFRSYMRAMPSHKATMLYLRTPPVGNFQHSPESTVALCSPFTSKNSHKIIYAGDALA